MILEVQISGKDIWGIQQVKCLFYLQIYMVLFLISLGQGKVDPSSKYIQTLFHRHLIIYTDSFLCPWANYKKSPYSFSKFNLLKHGFPINNIKTDSFYGPLSVHI